jgi:riboflavin kinase / FMN adenylyltransferase
MSGAMDILPRTVAAEPGARAIPVYSSVDEIPADFGQTVAAIGVFDGVHRGHREILSAAAADARSSGARSLAITFSPHPEQFLRPATAPRLITPLAERMRLLATTGVDAILVLHFDAELARIAARDFTRSILVEKLHVRGMHEGQSFRFGHRAAASVKELAEFGREFGFTLSVHNAVRVHGLEVSSSAVRSLIAKGDIRRARWMLCRPFAVFSTPARGRGIGTRLLVPTVNLASTENLVPGNGVYVTRLTIGGRPFQSVSNVGNRPTFGEASFAIESHILNFEPVDLDETTPLKLEFLLRLRNEMTFPKTEALKEQIFKDVVRAKRYFRLARG